MWNKFSVLVHELGTDSQEEILLVKVKRNDLKEVYDLYGKLDFKIFGVEDIEKYPIY